MQDAANKVFPEIKTEYDYFVARFDNREIKLVYRIREYSLVPEHKVGSYRKGGIQMKRYGNPLGDGTVEIRYYQPYAVKQVSLKTKRMLIEKVLNSEITENNVKLLDKIENQWYNRNVHKTSTTPLMDKEAILLEVLANYYLGGVEGDGILTMDMSRTIRNREIVTIAGMMNSDDEDNIYEFTSQAKSNWEFRKMGKDKHKEVNRSFPQRWKKTKTHKLNELFSHKPTSLKTTSWKTGETIALNTDTRYEIQRLIDPTQPYVAEWCLVNTLNEFSFKEEVRTISPKVRAYGRIDDLTDDNEARYEMDTILVIEQGGETYYFDENITPISSRYII